MRKSKQIEKFKELLKQKGLNPAVKINIETKIQALEGGKIITK